jgi:hypothetical protein
MEKVGSSLGGDRDSGGHGLGIELGLRAGGWARVTHPLDWAGYWADSIWMGLSQGWAPFPAVWALAHIGPAFSLFLRPFGFFSPLRLLIYWNELVN